MKRTTPSVTHELQNLADDAKSLLAVTAHVAEDKVLEARKRLIASLEQGRDALEYGRDRAIEGADETIRSHPYQAIGVAFGLGALLSFLITRRG